jgi:hypothetical protein
VVRFAFVVCEFEAIKLFQKAYKLEAAIDRARKGVGSAFARTSAVCCFSVKQ